MYYFLQELLTIIRLTLSMMTGYQGVMNDWGEIPANAIDMPEVWIKFTFGTFSPDEIVPEYYDYLGSWMKLLNALNPQPDADIDKLTAEWVGWLCREDEDVRKLEGSEQ